MGQKKSVPVRRSISDIEELPETKQLTVTVCIAGFSGAGKTTFVYSWLHQSNYASIPADGQEDWIVKEAGDIAAEAVELRILDTEMLRSPQGIIHSHFWPMFNTIIFVFDMSLAADDSSSILCSRGWMTEIREYARRASNIVIIGNKCDSASPRAREAGEEVAQLIGAKFFAVSSRDGTGVLDATTSTMRDGINGVLNGVEAPLIGLGQTPAFSPQSFGTPLN